MGIPWKYFLVFSSMLLNPESIILLLQLNAMEIDRVFIVKCALKFSSMFVAIFSDPLVLFFCSEMNFDIYGTARVSVQRKLQ